MTNGKRQMKWNRGGIGAAVLFAITSGLGCTAVLGDFSTTHESMTEDSGVLADASGEEAGCQRGVQECRGNELRTCGADGVMRTLSCPNSCNAGKCLNCKTGNCGVQWRGFFENVRQRWSLGPGTLRPNRQCTNNACSGVCIPGKTQCDGTTAQTCKGTEWSSVQCPFACIDGACGKCDRARFNALANSGNFAVATALGGISRSAPICTPAACTGSCAPGSTQCRGRVVQTCVQGTSWVDATTPCPNACVEATGACGGTCIPGATRCPAASMSSNLETCSNDGVWETSACPFVCQSNKCAGECVPGTFRCNGIKDVEQCPRPDGLWHPLSTCTPGICDVNAANHCKGVCTPKAKRCMGRRRRRPATTMANG